MKVLTEKERNLLISNIRELSGKNFSDKYFENKTDAQLFAIAKSYEKSARYTPSFRRQVSRIYHLTPEEQEQIYQTPIFEHIKIKKGKSIKDNPYYHPNIDPDIYMFLTDEDAQRAYIEPNDDVYEEDIVHKRKY